MPPRYYLQHVKDKDFTDIKANSGQQLPETDLSEFISGFLNINDISPEALRALKHHNFARKSEYYIGQNILEDHTANGNETFVLKEPGSYEITLSGPGYDNTSGYSRFIGTWEKPAIHDTLIVNENFTWKRTKQVDSNFTLEWSGMYSYTDNLIVFSCDSQGYKGEINATSGVNIPHYGMMYGPIENNHTFTDPIKEQISGIISGIISDKVTGTSTSVGTGVIRGIGIGVATAEGSVTVNSSASSTISKTVSIDSTATISGEVQFHVSGMGYGTAYNVQLSGLITDNLNDALSKNAIFYGKATENVRFIGSVYSSGMLEGKSQPTDLGSQTGSSTLSVSVSGIAYENTTALLKCNASGHTDVSMNNAFTGTISGVVSGIISGIIEPNIMISGSATATAYSQFSTEGETTIIPNQFMKGQIEAMSASTQISGMINGIISDIPATGTLSGTSEPELISGIAYKTINADFSGQITADVSKSISLESVINLDNYITQTHVDSVINALAASLPDGVDGDSFGIDDSSVKYLYDKSLGRVISYGTIKNIITPEYLNEPAAMVLANSILAEMITTSPAAIAGEMTFMSEYEISPAETIEFEVVGPDRATTVGGRNTISIDSTGTADTDGLSVTGGDGGSVDISHSHPGSSGSGTTGNNSVGHSHSLPANTGSGSGDHYHELGDSTTGGPINNSHTHGIGGSTGGISANHTHGFSVDVGGHTLGATTKNVTGHTNGEVSGNASVSVSGSKDHDIYVGIGKDTMTFHGEIELEKHALLEGDHMDVSIVNDVDFEEFKLNLRDRIITAISNVLKTININETLYSVVPTIDMSGIVQSYITEMAQFTSAITVTGTATGTVTGTGSATLTGPISQTISGMISGEVENTVSSESSATIETIAYAVGFCEATGLEPYEPEIYISAFQSESVQDMINYYEAVSRPYITDSKNPGGRGSLVRYIGNNFTSGLSISYKVGLQSDRSSSTANLPALISAPVGTQNGISGLYFGGDGGDNVIDSFDLYRSSTAQDGFVKIVFNADANYLNTLEIEATSHILVLPDYDAPLVNGLLNNKSLAGNIAELYYCFSDVDYELDLDTSTLDGRVLSSYTLIYNKPPEIYGLSDIKLEEELRTSFNNTIYIEELDNYRRKMTFLSPMKSQDNNGIVQIKLSEMRRKFYFSIVRDPYIESISIDGTIHYIEDEDDDNFYKKHKKRTDDLSGIVVDANGNPEYEDDYYGIESNSGIPISITFTDENRSIRKELIGQYLKDCLSYDYVDFNENASITKSNNFVQTIDPFKMPKRDVLLFLMTEQVYTLTIYVEQGSEGIKSVTHEGVSIDSHDFYDTPIATRHFRDDIVEISVDIDSEFGELDKEYIYEQLIEVARTDFRHTNRDYEPSTGFDDSDPQVIKFFMPAKDVTLYLRQIDYRHTLRLIRSAENEPENFVEVDVLVLTSDGTFVSKYNGKTSISKENPDNPLANIWLSTDFKYGERIRVDVYFTGANAKYYRLDEEFLQLQISDININPRRLVSETNPYSGYAGGDVQSFFINMPNDNLDLVIKEQFLLRDLIITQEDYQWSSLGDYRITDIIVKRADGTVTNYGAITASTDLSPIIVRNVAIGEELIIAVKFSNVYIHLDNNYVYSQDAKTNILFAGENSGDGNTTYTWSQFGINETNSSPAYREYYQLMVFTMPDEDYDLRLRTVDRKFEVMLRYDELFIRNLYLKEAKQGDLNSSLSIVKSVSFPYSAFPVFQIGSEIRNNFIRIGGTPLAGVYIDITSLVPDPYYTELDFANLSGGSITTFQFELSPRRDTTIIIKSTLNAIVLRELNYSMGDVALEPGRYRVYFAGAAGGDNGGKGPSGGNTIVNAAEDAGCLPSYMKILTTEGFKRIDECVPGTSIVGYNGEIVKVWHLSKDFSCARIIKINNKYTAAIARHVKIKRGWRSETYAAYDNSGSSKLGALKLEVGDKMLTTQGWEEVTSIDILDRELISEIWLEDGSRYLRYISEDGLVNMTLNKSVCNVWASVDDEAKRMYGWKLDKLTFIQSIIAKIRVLFHWG